MESMKLTMAQRPSQGKSSRTKLTSLQITEAQQFPLKVVRPRTSLEVLTNEEEQAVEVDRIELLTAKSTLKTSTLRLKA